MLLKAPPLNGSICTVLETTGGTMVGRIIIVGVGAVVAVTGGVTARVEVKAIVGVSERVGDIVGVSVEIGATVASGEPVNSGVMA
jgi:hypothetical protein